MMTTPLFKEHVADKYPKETTICHHDLRPREGLVLPLQETLWSWDVKDNWPKRRLFTDELKSWTPAPLEVPVARGNEAGTGDPMFQPLMMGLFPIGSHIPKQKSLRATLQGLNGDDRPYQIFFTTLRHGDFGTPLKGVPFHYVGWWYGEFHP